MQRRQESDGKCRGLDDGQSQDLQSLQQSTSRGDRTTSACRGSGGGLILGEETLF